MERAKPTDSSADATLAMRIMDGDREAEAQLWHRYQRNIRAVLWGNCRDEELVRDLRNDTLETVIRNLRKGALRDPERLSAYVLNTAKNLLIGHQRKEGRRRMETSGDLGEERVSEEARPEEEVLWVQRVELVAALIEELPVPRDREALRRFYLERQEKDEICTALSISRGLLDRLLSRAKSRLLQLSKRSLSSADRDDDVVSQLPSLLEEFEALEREALTRYYRSTHSKLQICAELELEPHRFDELVRRAERKLSERN